MYFIAKYNHEILVRQMRRSFLYTENYQFPTYIILPLYIDSSCWLLINYLIYLACILLFYIFYQDKVT